MKYLIIVVSLLTYSCGQDCACTTVGSYRTNGSGWIESSRSNFVVDDCDEVTQGTNYEQSGSGYQIKVVTSCK